MTLRFPQSRPLALLTALSRTRIGRRFNVFTLLSVLLVGLVAWLILYPILQTWIKTLFADGHFHSSAFTDVFGSSVFWTAVRNSTIIVAFSGALALIFGSIMAWLNERTDAGIPFVSRLLPILPLLMPAVALSIGWTFLGDTNVGYLNIAIRKVESAVGMHPGSSGPINIASWYGMIFVYSMFLVPLPYLIVSAGLQNLDRSLEEAARMSGSGLVRTLRTVSLPSIRGALTSAVLLVVVEGYSLYSVPVIIGTRARINTLSVYTVSLITSTYPARIDKAVVVSFFLVACLGPIWFAGRRVQRLARQARIGGRANNSAIELGWWKYVARAGMVLYMLVTSVFPILTIALVSIQPFWTTTIKSSAFSLDNYRQLFDSGYGKTALTDSLKLGVVGATVAMAIAAVLAAFIAYNRKSHRSGAFGEFIDATLKLPAAVTHIVIGIAFVVALGAAPFSLYGTVTILLCAYVAVYMPAASTAAMSAASQVGPELAEASWMSGASSARTFARISLPLMRGGLAAGWALVFVSVLGDLTISSLLSGGPNPVVGFLMLNYWTSGTYPEMAALAIIITALSMLTVGVALTIGRGRNRARR